MIGQEYDVVVVGCGPAGSATALTVAKTGLKVLMIEKRAEVGAPKRCAEALSKNALKRMGIELNPKCIVNEIYGQTVYAPNGKFIRIDYPEKQGWIVERKIFDKYLAYEAARAGTKILAKTECIGLIKNNNKICGVKLKREDEELEIKAKIVVACDGVESKLAREADLDTTLKLIDISSCAQFEMAGVKIDPKRVELYFGNEMSPGGYCLTPDTEIITKNTVKSISNVKIGEEALTMNGWVPVSAISTRNYSGEIISVIPFLFNNEVKLTSDHLVYAWNKKEGFIWKKAKELIRGSRSEHNGDYLVFPIPNEPPINSINLQNFVQGVILDSGKIYPIGRNQFGAVFKYKHGIPANLILTNELMEFFGYYISEGSTNSNGIIISNSNQKIIRRIKKIGEKIFGFEPSLWTQKRENRSDCTQVHFASKILKKLFEFLFGIGCHNKHIPLFFLGLSDELKTSFLIGLLRGDGDKERKSKRKDEYLNFTTTSKRLLYDLWMLLSTLSIVGSIGRIKSKNAYRLRIYGKQLDKLNKIFGKCRHGKLKNSRFFIKDRYVFMGIRSLKREKYTGKVYDIQSGGSFCPGFIVHNCWIFPKGKDIANVGVGVRKPFARCNAYNYLKRFVNSKEGLKSGSIIEVNAGGVPVGGLLENMVLDNFMIVGDAAHQVNPIHGGGISEAYLAGKIASEVIIKAIKINNTSAKVLSEYNKKWWEQRGNKLKKIVKLRQVAESLSDDELNWLVNYLSGEDLIDFSRGAGLKKLAKLLMKKPKLIKLARKLL